MSGESAPKPGSPPALAGAAATTVLAPDTAPVSSPGAVVSVDAARFAGDVAWQEQILPGVSRTFALTIPALPPLLRLPVTTAYLLCRVADTIEDEATLSQPQKRDFSREFVRVCAGGARAETFSRRLYPLLSQHTLPAERELVRHIARAVRVLESLPPAQREALVRCVRIMCAGMERFQLNASLAGLGDLAELDRYCYHVAGVVGETLTTLFCDYSPEIAGHQDELARLAVSFGQGLQMTNILKDIWDDRRRGACWLPRSVFRRHGFELEDLAREPSPAPLCAGLRELVGVAHGHLQDALRWTLLIPAHETGIRQFALWSLGMALLTLRKIERNPQFRAAETVKIKRRSVKATILVARLSGRSDVLLRRLFDWTAARLPDPPALEPPKRATSA